VGKMREIKFRAWDKELKVMEYFGPKFYVDDEYFELNFEPTELEGETPLFETNQKLILMQYTGLKDKNEKEIYEGDIIENKTSKTWKGKYKVYYESEFMSFLFEGIENEDDYYRFETFSDKKDWEIIGNIYENPEFLNKHGKE